MSRPLVALLTDFGLEDHYVGVVKSVILGMAPDAPLVDLSHAVPPQDVRAGAFLLMQSVEYLPRGAIILAVVDPGVGSGRRALAVQADGLTLVGPDNGLVSWALARLARLGRCAVAAERGQLRLGDGCQAVALDRPRHWLPRVSRTFHGRDVFAPVVGRLAGGTPLAELGSSADRIVALPWPVPRSVGAGAIETAVVHVDRFGNLITGFEPGRDPVERVELAGRTIAGLSRHYVRQADLIALIGSGGLMEVAAPGGSAAATLGVGVGAPVRVWVARPSGDAPEPRVSSE
jgi:S-adenosylmethionine hydrolase